MSEPMVVFNGKKYTMDEATELGMIQKRETVNTESTDEEHAIEIIIDEDTRSFRLQVNESDGVDIPKSILIDAFQISGFRSIRNIIEEDGLDYETLVDIAKAMDLL